jgi:hypothetical protein
VTSVQSEHQFAVGDVVYCHNLHLDTAEVVRQGSGEDHLYVYRAKGKPRPLLIIRDFGPSNRVRWYDARKLSTKIDPFKQKLGYIRLGKILDPEKDSYLDTNPHLTPGNLILRRHRRLHRLVYNGVIAEISRHALGAPSAK